MDFPVEPKEEFKTPGKDFYESLQNYRQTSSDNLVRMSLYQQFDPLIATQNLNNTRNLTKINNGIDLNDGETDVVKEELSESNVEGNVSGTLIQINTPAKVIEEKENVMQNGHSMQNGGDYENLLKMFTQFLTFNHEFIQCSKTKVDTQNAEYDTMKQNYAALVKENQGFRALLEEMTVHEATTKQELIDSLKANEVKHQRALSAKDEEYEKLRYAYEDIAQRGGNSGEMSKLQTKIKFLESKLKSTTQQLENKIKENEELSNMMNEFCGNQ